MAGIDFPVRLLATVLAALVPIAAAGAQDFTPAELMRMLASRQGAHATFVETRTVHFADQPLRSSGELSFTAPDRLEKHTLQPREDDLLLQGEHLTLRQDGRLPMGLDLQANPEAAAFVESIRGTLAGDLDSLSRYYDLRLSGRASRWTLVLVPLQPRMLQVVERIEMQGAGADVRRVVFEQPGGDRTEMRITPDQAP